MGNAHTHFDDVESFLYVLLLFFFSYAGPLPKADLESAHEKGFVRPIESGCLPHVRHWPQQFIDWADGSAGTVGRSKSCHISSPHCVKFLLQDDEVGNVSSTIGLKICNPLFALCWRIVSKHSGRACREVQPRKDAPNSHMINSSRYWMIGWKNTLVSKTSIRIARTSRIPGWAFVLEPASCRLTIRL